MAVDNTPPFREWPSNTFGPDGQRCADWSRCHSSRASHHPTAVARSAGESMARPPGQPDTGELSGRYSQESPRFLLIDQHPFASLALGFCS